MSIAKDALTSEVCHVVITKLAYLAGAGQEALLREAGVSDAQISKLEKLSYRELDAWIRKNKGELEISPFMQAIFPESNIPPEWKAFLQHGANNKMMKHYFETILQRHSLQIL